MTTSLNLRFERYDAQEARSSRQVVEGIYEHAYVDFIESGNEFDSTQAFMERFDAYASNAEIDLIVAFDGNEAVGQAWGWPLSSRTGWWTGLLTEPEPRFTVEDGHRTFALSEIMTVKAYTGLGVAHAMHDELLRRRPECRATLLAEHDNDSAYRAYLRWGWLKVSELRPAWPGAPTFDVLMLDLENLRLSGAY